MTDSLREKLVYVCTNVADLYLSESETDSYPYVVYDMISTPLQTKDGVAGYTGDTKIRIVGQDLDNLDTIRSSIETAISTGMHDTSFGYNLRDVTKECTDGIWTIEMNYVLRQYADWTQPQEQEND